MAPWQSVNKSAPSWWRRSWAFVPHLTRHLSSSWTHITPTCRPARGEYPISRHKMLLGVGEENTVDSVVVWCGHQQQQTSHGHRKRTTIENNFYSCIKPVLNLFWHYLLHILKGCVPVRLVELLFLRLLCEINDYESSTLIRTSRLTYIQVLHLFVPLVLISRVKMLSNKILYYLLSHTLICIGF